MKVNMPFSISEIFSSPFKKTDDPSMANGKIDNDFAQGSIGDCALLSSVFSIAQTEEGAKCIEDAIEINRNKRGKITGYDVTFKGTGETYHITPQDLKSAKQADINGRIYSTGDDDLTILELAFEQAFKESQDETLRNLVDSYTSLNLVDKLRGVNPASVTYLLMGDTSTRMTVAPKEEESLANKITITGQRIIEDIDGNEFKFEDGKQYIVPYKKGDNSAIAVHNDSNDTDVLINYNSYLENILYKNIDNNKAKIKGIIENYDKYKDNSMLVFAVGNGKNTALDPKGKTVELSSEAHAYAIKDINNGVVTLVNPQDSANIKELTVESLYSLNYYDVFIYNMDGQEQAVG